MSATPTHQGTTSLVRRDAPYRRLLTGTTTSAAGTGVGAVALPVLAVSVFAAPPQLIGVLEAAVWAPWLLIGLPAGAWVDRWSGRRLAMIADAGSAALFAAVPLLAALGALRLWQLIVLAFAAGVTAVISQAAVAVLPPALVADADLESANAGLQGAESATDVLSPAVSSALTHLLGIISAFTANAISFAVSVFCLWSLSPAPKPCPPASTSAASPSIFRDVTDGLRLLFGHHTLRRLSFTSAAINATLTGVGTLQALLLINTVGVRPALVGVLLVGEGVGGVLGAMIASPVARQLGTTRALAVVPAITFPFGFLTALTYPGAGLALFVVGTSVPTLGVVCSSILMRSLRQRSAPRSILGRVSSGSQVVGTSAAPIAALVSGAAAGALGARPTIAGFWLIAVTAAALLVLNPIRNGDQTPPSQPSR